MGAHWGRVWLIWKVAAGFGSNWQIILDKQHTSNLTDLFWPAGNPISCPYVGPSNMGQKISFLTSGEIHRFLADCRREPPSCFPKTVVSSRSARGHPVQRHIPAGHRHTNKHNHQSGHTFHFPKFFTCNIYIICMLRFLANAFFIVLTQNHKY